MKRIIGSLPLKRLSAIGGASAVTAGGIESVSYALLLHTQCSTGCNRNSSTAMPWKRDGSRRQESNSAAWGRAQDELLNILRKFTQHHA